MLARRHVIVMLCTDARRPRRFFANERTFIQWLGVAVLLVTMAVGLIAIDLRGAREMGFALGFIAVVFLLCVGSFSFVYCAVRHTLSPWCVWD